MNTQYEDNITCPFCGYVDRDSWEVDFGGMEGEEKLECGECQKEFVVTKHIEVTYSSQIIKEGK